LEVIFGNMPKGKTKSKLQNLHFEEEEATAEGKEPSPKLKTVATDYRLKHESPGVSTYKNLSPREVRARTNARTYRRQSRSPSSDGTDSQVTVKAAPLLRRRNYNANWRNAEDRPSNVTSWREARARSPASLFKTYHLRSNTPRRDNGRWRATGPRRSPRLSSPEKFHETFTLKLTTDETVELRGLKSEKLYARFPEGTYIIADAQNKQKRGERTYQASKAVQVPERMAEMSTFQTSFGKMRL
jgi:hypothetical protein